MSAIAALKGYRTQFLFSLYYILKNQNNQNRYQLEGTEDLDVINQQGTIEYYIQVKNTASPITLSDLLTEKGTSFIRRYIELGNNAIPVLVSFGQVSSELLSWKSHAATVSSKEKSFLLKYKLNEADWLKVKKNVVFELVNEDALLTEIYELLKEFKQIDPLPTFENLLYWLSYAAEKQQAISYQGVFQKIEQIAIYLSERIAITNRYGLYIKPLHQIDLTLSSLELLQRDYYYGTSARYEHIMTDQDVIRDHFLSEIKLGFEQTNIVIIHGASGQGKTSLAYRYAHNYAPGVLIYEIVAQEDIVATNEAILALHSIVKKLSVPVLLIINVAPNTVYWLRIVEETSAFKDLSFLVTVRNEDWFRAKSAELNFSYTELEISLYEHEAELIYQGLLKKEHKTKYSDFKEAWLDLGENMPLMEFTYAITQGDSLLNRLQQQVLLLNEEEQNNKTPGQIAILRMISLADYTGARIDASKLKALPGVQFIIQKFEREYLLKQTDDKKYIIGLHPIRSTLLCELLFDEFLFSRKDEMAKCLDVIEEADVYLFLLKCLYDQILSPNELIEIFKNRPQRSWVVYRSMINCLLWAGSRDYLNTNKSAFNEAYHFFGDFGVIFLDVFNGVKLDVSVFWDMIDDEKKAHVNRLKEMVSPKTDIFQHLLLFFRTVDVPKQIPISSGDWLGVAESMFWSSQFPDNTNVSIQISGECVEEAFAKLELEVLSKVMLGLHFYSKEYDQMRLKSAPVFIRRMRDRYKIPELIVEEEVTINYILDITSETEEFSVHDQVLEIIDIIRDAFPDKKKFNTQAHGHRNLMIELPYDESTKTISSENLPLGEWVNLNAIIRKLHEYSQRPADWFDFLNQLKSWEHDVKGLLRDFMEAFATLKRTNGVKLVKVMEQGNRDFGFELKFPQSIADPFGLYVRISKTKSKSVDLARGAIKENTLNARHQQFFKNYRDFKSDIENFIKQSGKVVYERLKNSQEPSYPVDSHLLHLSYVNLFNAIVKRKPFVEEKNKSFKDLLKLKVSEISEAELFGIATIWRDFNTAFPSNNFKNLALKEKITGVKTDFENAIIKILRRLSKDSGYSMRYVNSQATDFEPVFIIDAPSSAEVLIAINSVYDGLRNLISQPDYSSLKQLVMLRFFVTIYIIPLVSGRTFNHNYYKFQEYLFRDFAFNELKLHHLMTHPMPEHLIKSLSIGSWIDIYSPMNDIYVLHSEYVKMRLLVEHLADLQHFDKIDTLDEHGHELVVMHMEKATEKLQLLFQSVLDKLTDILNFHEFNHLDIESETLYIEDLNQIKNSLFPTTKGDEVNYEAKLTMDIIAKWAARLGGLNESWGRFTLILQNKALQHYQNSY
jgi:hypothetical protein